MKVFDATDKVLGRFASKVASELRSGEEVRVVNSEEAVISGDPEDVYEDYRTKQKRGRRDRGPYFPKRSDNIMKRTVRGMLPSDKEGREQLSNLKAFIGEPDGLEGESPDVKEGGDLRNRNYVKLGDVAEHIGGEA